MKRFCHSGWFGRCLLGGVICIGTMSLALPARAQQFIPVPTARVGPLANLGLGLAAGWLDYMQLLNDRDGGIQGVKLVWEECEFEYKPDRAIECYERFKSKAAGMGGLPFVNLFNTPASYALADRVVQDKVPMLNIGVGRADAADGRVFPWVFPLISSYYSGNNALVQFIAQREGGIDRLKGKKIAFVYHDTAFGKEELPIMELQARRYGFEVLKVPVAPPGTEQQSQWLLIRQQQPDWVMLKTLGVMSVAALKMAGRVGFPIDRIVGGWWSGTTDDVVAAGDAAKGYIGASLFGDGQNFPVIQEIIRRYYVGGKKGNAPDLKMVGTSNYNMGIGQAIMMTEAIRTAMTLYGSGKPVNGEQVRNALEQLNIDEKRVRDIGAWGLVPTVKTSCADHEGSGAVRMHQWDGSKWTALAEWTVSDRALVRGFTEQAAAGYAKEKKLSVRDCR